MSYISTSATAPPAPRKFERINSIPNRVLGTVVAVGLVVSIAVGAGVGPSGVPQLLIVLVTGGLSFGAGAVLRRKKSRRSIPRAALWPLFLCNGAVALVVGIGSGFSDSKSIVASIALVTVSAGAGGALLKSTRM